MERGNKGKIFSKFLNKKKGNKNIGKSEALPVWLRMRALLLVGKNDVKEFRKDGGKQYK